LWGVRSGGIAQTKKLREGPTSRIYARLKVGAMLTTVLTLLIGALLGPFVLNAAEALYDRFSEDDGD
jgi:hypothetical protein